MVEADLGLYDYCALVPVLTGAGGVMPDWEVRATCPNLMRDRAWCKFDLSCLGQTPHHVPPSPPSLPSFRGGAESSCWHRSCVTKRQPLF